MSTLMEKMIEDMQLAGLNPRTQESYSRSVRQLIDFCKKSPNEITDIEIRNYFLYVKNEKKWASTSSANLRRVSADYFYSIKYANQPVQSLHRRFQK